MAKGGLVYVGTYSEPILFGTGQVVAGQGKRHLLLPLRSGSGRARSRRRHRGRAQLILPRVRSNAEIPLLRQRVQGVRRKSERRCQRIQDRRGQRRAHLPQHEGEPRHGPLPPDRRQVRKKRADRQLRERQRLRAADRARRVAEGCELRYPARRFERRPEAPGRPARPRRGDRRGQPLRLRAGARSRQGDDLRARRRARQAHAEQAPALRQRWRRAPARASSSCIRMATSPTSSTS